MNANIPLILFGALLIGTPAAAADTATDKCAALNYLFAQARTEFPELAHAKLAPGTCSLVRQEFKCRWGFAGDRYVAAQEQASRLNQCAAAASRAAAVKAKGGEVAYQLNPETSVFIQGPQMDAGEWALTLRIVSSADWK
jgi:hypothetical protein